MTPLDLTAGITATANALACKLTDEEIVLLGTVLAQLGGTLLTIASIRPILGRPE